MPIERKTVMVSSTVVDLPEHRKEVKEACLNQGMFPLMMEHLPANDNEAISTSLGMVDKADIYVGVFAHRYGYMPKGHKISVTEMEYNRAVERKIPRLIFVMDKDHPIKISDIEMGKGAKKLETFKKRLLADNFVNFFKSPAELRVQVLNSLSKQIEATPVAIPDKETAVIDVTTYYNALRKRYNVLALEGLTPPQKEEYLQIQLRSVFVEQSVREDTPPVELPKEMREKLLREEKITEEDLPSGITLDDVRTARESYYQKPSQLVLDALTDKGNKYTIILGDPGSGKSTLARYVMLSLIDPTLAEDKIQKPFEGYLPLLIELRTFAGMCTENKCETPLEFLDHLGKTEGWGLTQSALHNHLKNDGRAVVIFDGLDEIFEPKLRETITNQIVGFTNTYPKARVIVTSRILGYRRKILSDAGFTHFTLQDLNEEQVKAFITKWYELAMSDRLDDAKERSERILKSFKDSASIRQLAGNPMLLTIMAIIGKHQELPRERWKLYDHAASVLIQHWDVNKHLKDENLEADFIGEDDKKELLRRLAYRMQSGDGGLAGNYIHREGLQDEFESYLKERYSKAPDQAKVIAKAMIQQFRERNFILSLYGANLYGFVHRAFLEYFCASAFVWKFEKTKELTIEQLKADVYGKHWEDQNWHEVLRLICGMIDEKWAGKLIDYLTNGMPLLHSEEGDNRPQWNVALAIQCLNEVRNISVMSDVASRLIPSICGLISQVFRKPFNDQNLEGFIEKQIQPIVLSIDLTWPKTTELVKWLRKLKPPFGLRSYSLSEMLGSIVGTIGSEYDEVHKIFLGYANHKSSEYRDLASPALAYGWYNDPSTLNLLYKLASKDADAYVKWIAFRALAMKYHHDTNFLSFAQKVALQDSSEYIGNETISTLVTYFANDPQTLPFLQKCAVQSINTRARKAAVSALAEHYREDAETLPLLRERAVGDDDSDVRRAAVLALAKHYHEDAETLPLLRERAVGDDDSDVRRAAVSVLVEYYREDAETLPLLRERAVKDESPKSEETKNEWETWDKFVREKAINAIAIYWSDDPDTLPLLRDRAKNDPTPWLRERAKELIEEIEGKKE